jgi:hypothetical protein
VAAATRTAGVERGRRQAVLDGVELYWKCEATLFVERPFQRARIACEVFHFRTTSVSNFFRPMVARRRFLTERTADMNIDDPE